mmetsp:Transcript_12158/g.41297  ORF Transcript_12158/g.41297 Transcript_12158/m.41297 type:complete len:201 (-) Transcript_12158:242-844(-)
MRHRQRPGPCSGAGRTATPLVAPQHAGAPFLLRARAGPIPAPGARRVPRGRLAGALSCTAAVPRRGPWRTTCRPSRLDITGCMFGLRCPMPPVVRPPRRCPCESGLLPQGLVRSTRRGRNGPSFASRLQIAEGSAPLRACPFAPSACADRFTWGGNLGLRRGAAKNGSINDVEAKPSSACHVAELGPRDDSRPERVRVAG